MLTTGTRIMTGYVGDWYETEEENDIPSRIEEGAPPFDEAVDCVNSTGFKDPGCTAGGKDDFPLYRQAAFEDIGPVALLRVVGKPWIDRDLSESYDAEVDSGLISEVAKSLGQEDPRVDADEEIISGASSVQSVVTIPLLALVMVLLHRGMLLEPHGSSN
jgi:hypothetical protein